MGILEVSGIAIVGGVAALIITELGGKLGFSVKLITVVIITIFVAISSKDMLSELISLTDNMGDVARYYEIVLRTLGVAIIAHIAAGVCRDCGAETVASAVETAARLEIFVLCLPLIGEIVGSATRLFEVS